MKRKVLAIEHAPKRSFGIAETIHKTHPEVEVVIARAFQGDKFPDYREFDGIIPGGGPMGVYELNKPENAFLLPEIDYLMTEIEAKIPMLAICFGHQLIAHLFGGTIVRDEGNREVGWTMIQLNAVGEKSALFHGVDSHFCLFQYHNDHVITVPEGAKVLASSQKTWIQALEYIDRPIWSVQFHPEISPELGSVIIESTRDKLELSGFNVEEMLALANCSTESVRAMIFNNFLNSLERK